VSLADHSEQVLAGMKAWVERMEERSDFRMKVGRELSRANIEALRAAYATIGALLEKADKPSEDEAEAAKAALALRLALTDS
jgi:ferredoxin-thioredoxin reductase catalytic subunit